MLEIILAGLLFAPPAAAQEGARELEAGSPAQLVDILLDNKNFKPIDIYRNGGECMPVTWRGCKVEDIMSRLKKQKPAKIKSEPAYEGSQQLYGSMRLGDRKDDRYWFVLDIKAPDDMKMYFDFDNSGRLDQHAALENMGSFKKGENGFATLIPMPWDQMIEDSPYHGEFGIWFILNSFQWANAGFSHSSHTELKGTVDLGGVPYTAVIVDQAENDNDGVMTNDGLWLKRGQSEARYISADEAESGALVDGKRYKFRIRYDKSGAR